MKTLTMKELIVKVENGEKVYPEEMPVKELNGLLNRQMKGGE